MTEGIIQKTFKKFKIEYPYSKSKDYINQESIDQLQQELIEKIKQEIPKLKLSTLADEIDIELLLIGDNKE